MSLTHPSAHEAIRYLEIVEEEEDDSISDKFFYSISERYMGILLYKINMCRCCLKHTGISPDDRCDDVSCQCQCRHYRRWLYRSLVLYSDAKTPCDEEIEEPCTDLIDDDKMPDYEDVIVDDDKMPDYEDVIVDDDKMSDYEDVIVDDDKMPDDEDVIVDDDKLPDYEDVIVDDDKLPDYEDVILDNYEYTYQQLYQQEEGYSI
jgi:hypothetical protein